MATRKKKEADWKQIGLAAAGGAGGFLAAKGAKKAGAMVMAKVDPDKLPDALQNFNPGSAFAAALGVGLVIWGKKPLLTGAGVGMTLTAAADLVQGFMPESTETAVQKRGATIEDAEILETVDLETEDTDQDTTDVNLAAAMAMAEDLDLD